MSQRRSVLVVGLVIVTLGCSPPPPAVAPLPEARLEIADLYARFAAAANHHAWDEMVQLMAEDARWEASAGALGFRHRGRQAIRDWLVGNEGKIEVLIYLPAPPRIELVAPELARAQTSISELLLLAPSGEIKQLYGVYHDELQKRGGRWFFAARRFELRHEETVVAARAR